MDIYLLLQGNFSVAIIISACKLPKGNRDRCTWLSEGLFRFAIDVTERYDRSSAMRIMARVLTLFPFFKNEEIIKKALELSKSISIDSVPVDIREHYRRVKNLMEEIDKMKKST